MSRLEPGQKAPEWTLKDSTGQQVSLSDFEDRKVIIYFYPAAMTPGCTTQANDFRDNYDVFTKKGYVVLGISPDDTTKLARFVEREEINFPVLSDPEKSVLVAYGAYGEKNLYGKTITGVIRSTVVIDGNGVVTLAKYNVRATGHVASLAKQLNIELD
ncbi:thioredoxin-dependent thiol peroxidase [Ornithinimicrobium sp. Arc0846-15]|nr:thioredoxin-dependent thiol peroxidase [Ornithinimicrobium laminariae]